MFCSLAIVVAVRVVQLTVALTSLMGDFINHLVLIAALWIFPNSELRRTTCRKQSPTRKCRQTCSIQPRALIIRLASFSLCFSFVPVTPLFRLLACLLVLVRVLSFFLSFNPFLSLFIETGAFGPPVLLSVFIHLLYNAPPLFLQCPPYSHCRYSSSAVIIARILT